MILEAGKSENVAQALAQHQERAFLLPHVIVEDATNVGHQS